MDGLFVSADTNGALAAHDANDEGKREIPVHVDEDGNLAAEYFDHYLPAKLQSDGRLTLPPWGDLNSEYGNDRWTDSAVYSVAISSNKIYAGGIFTHIGSSSACSVAVLDEEVGEWMPLDSEYQFGSGDHVTAVETDSLGNLYMGGLFTDVALGPDTEDIMSYITCWDGSSYNNLFADNDWVMQAPYGAYYPGVYCLQYVDGDILAGGFFDLRNPQENEWIYSIAKWTGTNWEPVAGDSGQIYSGSGVNAICVAYDSKIYIGGAIANAVNGVSPDREYLTVNHITWTDGTDGWKLMGNGLNHYVFCIGEYDDDIYVGGYFTAARVYDDFEADIPMAGLARWDGNNWQAVEGFATGGSLTTYSVNTIYSDDQYLYVGGIFRNFGDYVYDDDSGKNTGSGIVRYNFTTEKWVGFSPTLCDPNTVIYTLETIGGSLYAGFRDDGMMKFDGQWWYPVGGAEDLEGDVYAITVHDSQKYAGGTIYQILQTGNDPIPVHGIACYSGSAWAPVGTGFLYESYPSYTRVNALESWQGQLYAGGNFTSNYYEAEDDRVDLLNLAFYDTEAEDWSPLSPGGSSYSAVQALKGAEDGLYVGGSFRFIGGILSDPFAVGYNQDDGWFGMSTCEEGWKISNTPIKTAVGGTKLYGAGRWSDETFEHRYFACWDGTRWEVIEPDEDHNQSTIRCVAANNSNVYIVVRRSSDGVYVVAEYNGTGWQEIGDIVGSIHDKGLEALDDGSVFLTGSSLTQIDEVECDLLARRDGTEWFNLGGAIVTDNHNMLRQVNDLAKDDDDNLYVGGSFTGVGVVDANNICLLKEDGSLSSLDNGLNGTVNALIINGSTIIAGGDFTIPGHVAAFIDDEWTEMGDGLDGAVWALILWDSDVYAGGEFTPSGEVTVNNIARYSGSSWYPLGEGLNGKVMALAAGQLGLYAGGDFLHSGALALNRVGFWDGDDWFALGDGVNNHVTGIAAYYDQGEHVELCYVCGHFNYAGSTAVNYIALWDGVNWQPLGSGLNGIPQCMVVEEGSGDIYVAGSFTRAGGVFAPGAARWDGSQWRAVGDDLDAVIENLHWIADELYAVTVEGVYRLSGNKWQEIYSYEGAIIRCLAEAGDDIVMGGTFTRVAGCDALRVAMWDGEQWQALGDGIDSTYSYGVVSKLIWHDGILYAIGTFTMPNSEGGISRAAYFDGDTWHPIGNSPLNRGGFGSGYNGYYDMAAHNNKLYLTDYAENVFVWDGESLEPMAGVLGRYLSELPGDAGLLFALASGRRCKDIPAIGIARWDGADFHAMPGLISGEQVNTIEEHNGELYIGGRIGNLGHVARWDTESQVWETVAGGVSQEVLKLRSIDSRLFACCADSGGVLELTESGWTKLNSGYVDNSGVNRGDDIYDVALRDNDGEIEGEVAGLELFVGGNFTSIVGQGPGSLVRWDGDNWELLCSGSVREIIADPDSGRERLIMAGAPYGWSVPGFTDGVGHGVVQVGEFHPT